jgi:hypothetical protein
MVMRYLGSTANVVASSLGLVTLLLCVIFDAGWATFPIVIGVYAVSAVIAWILLPQRPIEDPPTVRPRRAAL